MMPWTVEYSDTGAEVRYWGRITGEDILEAKKQCLAHPFDTDPVYLLCDFSQVERFDVVPADVNEIVRQDRAAAASSHSNLIEVVIAPDPVEYGMARMWELQVEDVRPLTRVSHTRREAIEWLHDQRVQLSPEHDREWAAYKGN